MHNVYIERAKWLANVLEIRKKTVRELAEKVVAQRVEHKLDQTEFPRNVEALTQSIEDILTMKNSTCIMSLDFCFELAAAFEDDPQFYYRRKHFGEEEWPATNQRLRALQAVCLTPV